MSDQTLHPDQLLSAFLSGEFDFVDLGCGTGRSIGVIEKRLGRGRGIGFDLDAKKIAEGQSAGRPVVVADVTKLDFPKRCVSFATMFDFLEHLPNEQTATNILSALSAAVRDFLIIRHPSFEHREYLESLGLKLSWSDWRGHPNMMLLEDFRRVFASLGWNNYLILPQHQITDSTHESIVPLSAPRNTVKYDANLLGPKPFHVFKEVLYQQFDIFVPMRELEPAEWKRLIEAFASDAEIDRLRKAYSEAKRKRDETLQAYDRLRAKVDIDLNETPYEVV